MLLCKTDELLKTLFRQLDSFYFLEQADKKIIESFIASAQERIYVSFSNVSNKYYSFIDKETNKKIVTFDYLHQCQYAQFLYYLSNIIWKETQNEILCNKIYGLNKVISSCDMFYQVELPDIFFFDHPMGSVLGRANYSNKFSFSQGCTVGNNNGIYPVFEERVHLLSNSKVIGKSHIGKNVIITANTYVKDTDIPDNSIVYGQSPNLVIKNNKEKVLKFSKSIFVE